MVTIMWSLFCQAGMKKTYCERVAEEIRLCVNEKLEHYLK
jgi:serine/threonine-protein kinase HipA